MKKRNNFNFYNKSDYNKKQTIIFIILLMITLLINMFFYGYDYNSSSALFKNQGLAEKIISVKSIIDNEYLFANNVPEEQILDGTINGLVSSLGDPYSRYISSKNYEKFTTEIKGEFGGIGVTIKNDTTIVPEDGMKIESTLSGSNAENAGITSNDKIVSIDGVDIAGMEVSEAIEMIKGEEGTEVSLGVIKENETEPSIVNITRNKVELPVVSSELIDNNIGYMYLSQFTQTIVHQFDEAYENIKDADSLIIDLRFNTGGSVPETIELLSRFLGKDQVAVTMEKRNYSIDVTTQEPPYIIEKPIVLLVNEYSASASEIFAGALRSYGKATIVGTKTFGKALVQETKQLDESSLIVLTVAKYLTPAKEDINQKGILPDIEVLLGETEDTQLLKAIEILKQKE